jgi:WD40 repeat protein/serine/threonine protein kinase
VTQPSKAATDQAPDAQLWRRWRQGERPDVGDFLADFAGLEATEVVAVLLVDQRERWQIGERIPAESYLRRFPALESDAEAVVELAYGEFLLREERGERPALDEYLWRFPTQARRLRQQVHLHLALAGPNSVTDTAPEQPSTVAVPGAVVIPGYEVLQELGRGGMGVVYRARQIKADRVVALKMLLAGGHAGNEEMERFRIEAEAIARLQHPNIVSVYEVGQHQGVPFFSLEFCPGGGLDRKLTGTPLPPRQAATLLELLALAVQHAHERGVVHRDLKPGNVLLAACGLAGASEQGTAKPQAAEAVADFIPKITDFGLAKKLDEQGQTHTGSILGTPSYMAPEQARGEKGIGPAVDVYALGAILYECLTGRPPFKAATYADTVRQVLEQEPVPPRRLNPGVPRDLETICLKCLAKEPGRRYASASELAGDLRRFLEDRPIQARRTPGYERVWRWCRRNPLVAAASTAAVLLLVAVAAVSVVFALQQRRSAQREADATYDLRAEKEQVARALEEARLNEAQLTLEHALKLCEEGEQGNYRDPYSGLLWLARALELAPDSAVQLQRILRLNWAAWRRDVCPLQGAYPARQMRRVQWGRAGKVLVATSRDSLRCWDAVTGQAIGVPEHLPLNGQILSCSTDGRWAATAVKPDVARRHGVSIMVWDLQTDRLAKLAAPHPADITTLELSPDGSLILTGCADGKARLWERATGKLRGQPFDMPGPIRAVAFRPDGKVFAAGTSRGKARPAVRQWDISTGKALGKPIEHQWDCHSLAYSSDGKWFLVAFGYFLALFDAQTQKHSPPVFVHGEAIGRAAFAPSGETLAGCTCTGETYVWDRFAPRRPLAAPFSSKYPFTYLAINPSGQSIATANWTQGVRLWQMPSRLAHLPLRAAGPRLRTTDEVGVAYLRTGLRALALSPDGQCLATGGWNNTVELWEAQTGRPIRTLTGHDGVVTSLAFSKDGKRLLSGSTDRTARLWDLHTGTQVGSPFEHRGTVHGVDISSDGTRILTGAGDGTCKLWKATGEALKEWRLHGVVWDVAFNPDGRTGAAAHWQQVKILDLAAPYKIRYVPAGTHHIMALAFSPDGKRFIAAGMDKMAQLRETTSGKPIGQSLHHRDRDFPIDEPVTAPALVWSWMRTASWNRRRLLSVAVHPEGRIVATGDEGLTARLWDADSGIAIGPPLEHPGGVHRMTFTPDGKYLLTVSTDRVVRRWPVPVAIADDPALLMLRTQVVTGMELRDGAVRLLDAETWRARQRRLEELAPGSVAFFKPK